MVQIIDKFNTITILKKHELIFIMRDEDNIYICGRI